ncbi:hypothetical protein GCM10010342_57580 [Streptomyces anulatus]|nr:hypothetical protein GCM10010342_57580 [Streptomyces anulatus]
MKPANVLLRSDGRPVLTGFGFAALQDSTRITATGSIISSPDYMSPERVHGESSGPPADLWSLGMLLYVAVEGRHPLRRDSTPATLAAVLHEDVPRPRHAGALADVLMSLLVHDPEARLDARIRLLKHPYRGSHRPSRRGRAAGPCRYAWRRHPARRVATMRPASARS